jgi:hypothetical protein
VIDGRQLCMLCRAAYFVVARIGDESLFMSDVGSSCFLGRFSWSHSSKASRMKTTKKSLLISYSTP